MEAIWFQQSKWPKIINFQPLFIDFETSNMALDHDEQKIHHAYREFDIQFGEAILYGYKTGKGPRNMLLFYGFGQTYRVFDSVVSTLYDTHTCYCFDLFYHGKSEWSSTKYALDLLTWKRLLEIFFQKEHVNSFSALGFSIGGKAALATAMCFPAQTEHLIMIAAEGVRKNTTYTLATQTWLGRKLFQLMVKHPAPLFFFINLLTAVRIIPRKLTRFVISQFESTGQREKVYHTWLVYRHLRFSVRDINAVMKQYPFTLTLIGGSRDDVMPLPELRRTQKSIEQSKLLVIESGHNGLLYKLSDVLFKLLNIGY